MQDPSNLVWVDLEMTGLEPDVHLIIEVAILVTDAHLQVLEEGPCLAIHQSDEVLSRMDDWCTRTHTASGLVQRIRDSRVTLEEAEAQAVEFITRWVPEGRSPLCGNSVSHDRRFLRRYMPKFEAYLHYRHVDVSTIKELVGRWYPPHLRPPAKKGHHLALDDIRESVEELRWYRNHVFVEVAKPTSGSTGEDPSA